MKKLFVGLFAVLSLVLASCNANLGFGDFSFHYVHVQMYSMAEPVHLHVESWKSDDGGIELKVTFNNQKTSVLLGDGTYMLYDTLLCPICGEVNYK